MRRRGLLILIAGLGLAQTPAPPLRIEEKEPSQQVDFFCPMDKDVRSKDGGKCPRCGMKLIPSIADMVEYPVRLTLTPKVARTGQPVTLRFRVLDPRDQKTVEKFEVMHEKLFHLFLVSEDLGYFAHEHPEYEPGGVFRFDTKFPQGGAYRVVTDFFPEGGTPQMNASTLFVAGAAPKKKPLAAGLAPQTGKNLRAELVTEPAEPLAGFKTLLFFTLSGEGGKPLQLEPYLGAWGHMLAASEDLIDMVHTHPFIADGGPKVQFNMIFPREGMYRVWVQFQNAGVVNTVAFNVPVKQLR